MRRGVTAAVALVGFCSGLMAAVPPHLRREAALEHLRATSLRPPRVSLDPDPGAAYVMAALPAPAGDAEAAARQVVGPVAGLWGLADPARQLAVREIVHDALGFDHVVFQQQVDNVPVRNAWLVAHRDASGTFVAVHGRLVPGAPTHAQPPRLTAQEATRRALAALPWKPEVDGEIRPQLVYVPFDGTAVLAWFFDLPSLAPRPSRFQVAVDAVTGDVLRVLDAFATVTGTGPGSRGVIRQFEVSQSASGYNMEDTTRGQGVLTYDAANSQSRGNLVRSASTTFDQPSHAAAVDAHYFAEMVYDGYRALGRDSLDGRGMKIISTVHYGQNYANAGWTGSQMIYGDGDPADHYPFSVAPDVVAHELQHAVTDFTVPLEYWGQSGALNEAWSDIFGFFADPEDWLMGEDIFKSGGAFRSFENPNLYGDPATMDEFFFTRSDNLGVHYNSGIINHAFYHQVLQLGIGRLADLRRVYTRVLEGRYMTPTATFWDARNAVEQAARDLFGEGSDVLAALAAGFDAVGISGEPRALGATFVPAAASTPGLAGSQWVTDVRILNAGSASANLTMWYSVSGDDWYPANTPPKKQFTVAPGATLALDDVVNTQFGKSGTKGALEIRATQNSLLVAARTYNRTTSGTYGQYTAAVNAASGPTPTEPQHVLMLSGGGRYRSNVGFVETTGSNCFVDLVLRDATGASLASKTLYLGPWQHRQEEVFAFFGVTPAASARLEVKPRAGSNLLAYGSVIDNVSNDAVYVPAQPAAAAAGTLIVPAAIRKGGLAGSLWRTDLSVANLRTEAAVDVTLTFYPHDGSAPTTRSVALAPGETRDTADVMATLFGLDGVQGQIEVATGDGSAAGLLVASRTYTVASTPSGEASYGQFVPAVPRSSALRAGQVAYLPYLAGGASFRTNLGVMETAGEPASVELDILRADGSLAATLTRNLKPREWFQFLRVLDGVDLRGGAVASARVRVTSGAGRVVAYASVIDNLTNDPINVPMAVPSAN